MKEYQIQAYFSEPVFQRWVCISGVRDFQIPYMTNIEKATEVLDKINTQYAHLTGHKYRIVSRKVTPWTVEKPGTVRGLGNG